MNIISTLVIILLLWLAIKYVLPNIMGMFGGGIDNPERFVNCINTTNYDESEKIIKAIKAAKKAHERHARHFNKTLSRHPELSQTLKIPDFPIKRVFGFTWSLTPHYDEDDTMTEYFVMIEPRDANQIVDDIKDYTAKFEQLSTAPITQFPEMSIMNIFRVKEPNIVSVIIEDHEYMLYQTPIEILNEFIMSQQRGRTETAGTVPPTAYDDDMQSYPRA